MSQISDTSQPRFDFWQFVTCAKCHLPFSVEPNALPQTPFWLADCGHVICNNHLNSDQSCSQCGAQEIQLMPLQHEMDPPMSDWFLNLPYACDRMAAAAKFQQETMASLVQFYKKQCSERGALINRLKGQVSENKMLKKTIEGLRRENVELRQQMGHTPNYHLDEPSSNPNSNGKREMLIDSRTFRHGGTSSSPRLIVTPLGPDRLTLPAGQQAPDLSTRDHENVQSLERPGTSTGPSRFAQKYAYVPPRTPQLHSKQLSHAQTAPARHLQSRTSDAPERRLNLEGHIPPPLPSRIGTFKPQGTALRDQPYSTSNNNSRTTRNQNQDRRMMPPPPNPPQEFQVQQELSRQKPIASLTLPPSNRFLPRPSTAQAQRFLPPTPQVQNTRFIPSTPSGAPQRFRPSGVLAQNVLRP